MGWGVLQATTGAVLAELVGRGATAAAAWPPAWCLWRLLALAGLVAAAGRGQGGDAGISASSFGGRFPSGGVNAGTPVPGIESAELGARRLDMHFACAYAPPMPVALQIRNVPDDLHRKLKERAARAGMSLSEFLLSEVRQSAEQLTIEEMLDRLRGRTPVNLSESPADAIRAERDSR